MIVIILPLWVGVIQVLPIVVQTVDLTEAVAVTRNPIAKNLNRNRPSVVPNKKKHYFEQEDEMEEKSEIALVTALVKVQYTVNYNKSVNAEDAVQKFYDNDYYDITDTEELAILDVLEVALV